MGTRNTGQNAPTRSLDFEAEGRKISGCFDCLAWWAEVVTDDDGFLLVREHHAIDCETYQHALAYSQPAE